jgi:hypothetical protein
VSPINNETTVMVATRVFVDNSDSIYLVVLWHSYLDARVRFSCGRLQPEQNGPQSDGVRNSISVDVMLSIVLQTIHTRSHSSVRSLTAVNYPTLLRSGG